jgi:hypothetical protein
MNRILRVVPAAAVAAFTQAALAQAPQLTPQVRTAVLDSVIASVTSVYVDADTAKLIANHLRAQLARKAYDAITNPAQLGEIVTRDLRAINNDLHLGMRYAAPAAPQPATGGRGLAGPVFEQQRLVNYGMGRAEILDGNVGYLEITSFAGGNFEEPIVDALRFLSRTDAMIIDLRRNGGGSGRTSHFIFSHFLGATPVPTIDIRSRRSPEPQHSMSLADVPGPRRTDVPLFILTSQGTASAAEEFTFVLRNHKRATTVGTRTAGAGHMVTSVPVGHGFAVSLSITRVSDPVSGKEWEAVGVPADISVAPERALDAAHAAALNAILAKNTVAPPRANNIRRLIETIEGRSKNVSVSRLERFAGTYDGRSFTVRDGKLWYARRVGAMPEALVPLTADTFALGAIRFRFTEASGSVSLMVEQPDGTTIILIRS